MMGDDMGDVFDKVITHALSDDVVNDIEEFARSNCDAFNVTEDGIHAEQKLEYMELYQKMQSLFESKLAAFVETCGVTMEQFESLCEKVINAPDDDEVMAEKKMSLSFLTMVTDYETFVQMMSECKKEKDEGMALP
ncbi:Cilia- and flagella-associated protein 36 [Pycnococcus provasolii]